MNRIRAWFTPPSTPPTSHEGLPEPGASTPNSQASESSLSLQAPSTMSSKTASASNALGLSVDPSNETNTLGVGDNAGPSASSSASKSKLSPKPTTASRQTKSPTLKPRLRDRLSSLTSTFRDTSKAGTSSKTPTRRSSAIEHTAPPLGSNGKLAHLHARSDPVIETIRASPEDIVGPSAARPPVDTRTPASAERGRLGRGENRDLLLSSTAHSSPRAAGIAELQRPHSARSSTSPIPAYVNIDLPRTPKRLIVCCDG